MAANVKGGTLVETFALFGVRASSARAARHPLAPPRQSVKMAYIFKPKKTQVDIVGKIVAELKAEGLDIGVSKFYEFAADRAIGEYATAPDRLIEDMKRYLRGSENWSGG